MEALKSRVSWRTITAHATYVLASIWSRPTEAEVHSAVSSLRSSPSLHGVALPPEILVPTSGKREQLIAKEAYESVCLGTPPRTWCGATESSPAAQVEIAARSTLRYDQ